MKTEKLDIQAFNMLFEKYKEPFIRFAVSYIRDEQAAEDIFMDSMMYFWEKRYEIPHDVNAPGYILTIIKNRCLNYLRHLDIRTEAEADMLESNERIINFRISTLEACNPQELFTDEIQNLFKKSLNSMPKTTRSIFLKSRYEEKTNKQISEELGMSIKNVEYHISKALKYLKVVFVDYLHIVICCLLMR